MQDIKISCFVVRPKGTPFCVLGCVHKYINKAIQGNDNNIGYLNILFS